MNRNTIYAGLLLLLLAGCAAGLSPAAKALVTCTDPFSALQAEPERYAGEMVLLGGRILEVAPSPGATELIVLELPLDWQDRPKAQAASQGRFLVQAAEFLDPALYKPGALLTVVGTLSGSETRAIGGFDYRYPRLLPTETKLWPAAPASTSPAFHFGVGVGTHF
jgi:outer membrane lipoprotein